MMLKISSILRRVVNNAVCGLAPGFLLASALAVALSGCGEGDAPNSDLLGNFTLDVPIAYVKRPITSLANPRNATNFQPGGDLWLREYAAPTAPERNITEQYTRGCAVPDNAIKGDVSDPAVSYDGTKIVFAMIIGNYHPDDPDNCTDEELTWSLYEYDIESESILPVINPNKPILITATNPKDENGREQGDDIDPVYLPDGRIVFSSTRLQQSDFAVRQRYGVALPLFDEGGNNNREPTMNLHVMLPGDIASIKQITFNQSHDLNPSVLQNGKIIYSRWEQANNARNQFDIYQVNPDGTEQELLYGAHSHDTADGSESVFLHPRQIAGSPNRIITTVIPATGTFEGGELVYIDYENFAEIDVPKVTSGSSSSSGQSSATGGRVPVAVGNSPKGRYTTPFPIWDGTNRALVAWAPCKVLLQDGSSQFCTIAKDPNLETAPAEYGIWMMDLDTNTQRQMVFPAAGFTITDPVAVIDRLEAQNAPVIIQDKTAPADLDADLLAAQKGLLVIKSVYDTDLFQNLTGNGGLIGNEAIPCVGVLATPNSDCSVAGQSPDITSIRESAATNRMARFLRIVRPLPIIDKNGTQNMREIAGYIPIEPDGSVVVEVHANWPFAIEILGVNGQKIQKLRNHDSWLQIMPGETKVCNGCHSTRDGQPALNDGATTNDIGLGRFRGTVLSTDPPPPNETPPNPLPDPLVPMQGETMAETRARVTCNDASNSCSSRKLNADIVFDDVWQDPNNYQADNTDLHFAYRYQLLNIDSQQRFDAAALLSQPVPVPVQPEGTDVIDFQTFTSCNPDWGFNCRIVYNYQKHIHPIWEKPRLLIDDMGAAVNDVNGLQVDYKCTSCHTRDSGVAGVDRIPAAQLDLTIDGPTDANRDEITSFQELRLNDVAQELDNNVLTDASRNQFNGQVDDNGNPVIEMLPVQLPLSAELLPGGENALDAADLAMFNFNDRSVTPNNNTRNDGRLLTKMTRVPTVPCDPTTPCYQTDPDHSNMLSPEELRVIIEWIDTGARYFSDAVDAPDN